jgi:hypothetical protein
MSRNDTYLDRKAYTVYTYKNTTFKRWREMVLEEYAKLGIDPTQINPLREKHAWEGGDTTRGWAQHVEHNNKMRARTEIVKRMNPEK